MEATVGVVGLGLMGSAMTGTLLAAGYDVAGYDPDDERRAEFERLGGRARGSVADVLAECRQAILSLPNSSVSADVCLGAEGIADHAQADTVIVDTTTGRPKDAVAIAAGLEDRGVSYLDATISGNADQTARRDIVVMVGGHRDAFEAVNDLLDVLARGVHHVGPAGSGTSTKLIVNLILGVHRVVLAEGLVLGEKAGLDLGGLLDVLKDGAAYSRAMDIWGPRMVERDHYPPASRIRQNLKDFRLIVEYGQLTESPTFLASTVAQLLGAANSMGLGDADNSGVAAFMRHLAGVEDGPSK